MASGSTPDKLLPQIEFKLAKSAELLKLCDEKFSSVDGVQSFQTKIKSDQKFCHKLIQEPHRIQKKHIDSLNFPYFEAVLSALQRYDGCISVFKKFVIDKQKRTGRKPHDYANIDIVAGNGSLWVKIITRNARSTYLDYVGARGHVGRSLIEQAEILVQTSRQYPHLFRPPTVVFDFVNGVCDQVADVLRSMGVDVRGNEIPVTDIASPIIEDSDTSDDGDQSISDTDGVTPSAVQTTCVSDCDTINLDVTAMVAFCSQMTHGGTNFFFNKDVIDMYVEQERKRPALPEIMKAIEGKKIICCQTAFDTISKIATDIGGPNEQSRFEELKKMITIVEDKVPLRLNRLELTACVTDRGKIVFGSGDYYEAITLTANHRFYQSALQQGEKFAVILHQPRLLTEKKQAQATPLQ